MADQRNCLAKRREACYNTADTGRFMKRDMRETMNELEQFREQVAACDEKIMEMLIQRNQLVEKIMDYKERHQLPVLQLQQEEKQNRYWGEKLSGNRHKEELFAVFECIRRNSKKIQARRLFDYNIVLIGFMGVGKTTVSGCLSRLFALDVVEMDQVIAEREAMSIPDIFAACGEEYFRDLETALLVELQSRKHTVISCGGGAALRERNVAEMKKNGKVVLLTATPQTIYQRVKDSEDRPLLKGRKNVEAIARLMEERREKYEAAADILICTDEKSVLQVCEELIQQLTKEGIQENV